MNAESTPPVRSGTAPAALDPALWPQVEALFDALFEEDPASWEARLQAVDAPEAVRREVRSLLQASLDSAAAGASKPDETPGEVSLLQPGEQVGDWRIEGPLGRGGMGEVYAARREVEGVVQRAALKLLTALHGEGARRRFARERSLLARLEHPGIARFLDAGEHRGLPWMAMERVDGQPLDEALRGRPLDQRIDVFMQVCAAVAHAHRHLVLHCDLKPANVLLDAEGRVRLLDFGIARLLDDERGAQTATPHLSPEYAAPEQLRGEPLSTAADSFALGVLLHGLLTGQPLLGGGGSTLQRLAARLAQPRIEPPSRRMSGSDAPRVSGDLDAIVMKALRAEPEARYPGASALLEDLRAYRAGEPVGARAEERGYRTRHLLRRYRGWISAAAGLILVLGTASAAIAWQAHQAALERDLARREAERADALRQFLVLTFREAGSRGEGRGPTAREVLDGAAARLDRELADDPARLGGIALAITDLYFHLGDYPGAEPLLQRLLTLEGLDPAQRAMAEHDLAQVAYRQDRLEPATARLAAAQAFWAADAARYRSELLDSRLLESQLLRASGDREAALAVLQSALVERLEVSGRSHRDTGILLNNLGIAESELGRMEDAVGRFVEADTIWRALGLARSPDALNTLNNWASTEQRRQRPEVAIPLFEQALALRRELYGPSAAMAALQSNLGKTLLQVGRAAEARTLFAEAVPMAVEYAGPDSLLALSAGLGEADALSALGESAAARERLDALAPSIARGFPDAHPLGVLHALSQARWATAAGQPEARDQALAKARRRAEALGPAGRPYLAAIEGLRAAP